MKANKASIKILGIYANFADVVLPKLAIKFSKHMRINNYAIKLVDDQQLLYGQVYSLRPIELETLKIYFENNLANGVIRPF